jgi:hypothetical protein
MTEVKRLRILMDGAEILETPIGWEDITSSIKRVKELNALFITTEAPLKFWDDGYTYLINKYDEGYCTSVDCELQEYVDGHYQSFFTGIIFLRTAKIDRKNCTIEILIEDNSFYAKINNNKSIEVFPFASQTKSAGSDPINTQYAITPCAFTQVHLFDPTTGVGIGLAAPSYSGAAYPVDLLFEYLISFMSDNTLAFRSDLFSTGDYAGLVVTCGKVLQQYATTGTTEQDFKDNFSKISFKQLFEEVNKKINIGMYVEYNNTLPTIRIERLRDCRNDTTSFNALNIDSLIERIDVEELYGSVRLGSSTISDKANASVSFPEYVSFSGFKEEQFIVLSNCNIDKEKNLVSSFIISSNVIEDCLINGEDSYNDNLFFISCDNNFGVYVAQQNNLENQAATFPVFYNINLNGIAVMDNYYGSIPLSIAQYLGNNDNTFMATRTTNQSPLFNVYTTIIFDDDTTSPNHDANNNYDNTTGIYTIPNTLPAFGTYTFNAVIDQFQVGQSGLFYDIVYYFEHYNSANVLIQRYEVGRMNAYGYSTETYNITLYAYSTDYVLVTFKESASFNNVVILPGSHFRCTNTIDGGGLYATFNPEDYPAILHEWDYPLTYTDFKNIQTNQIGQIEFARYNEIHRSGWIDSLKFKRFSTEEAKFITYRSKLLPRTTHIPLDLREIQLEASLPDVPFTFSNVDYYGNPFGGVGTIARSYFFPVGSTFSVSIPAVYMGCAIGNINGVSIAVRETHAVGPDTYVLIYVPDQSVTITVQADTSYQISAGYDLDTPGNTFPHIYQQVTSPAVVGGTGTILLVAYVPDALIDFTFLWSTGETTAFINAVAGSYWVQCTYVPGTYDTNVITFNIVIPVSRTGS